MSSDAIRRQMGVGGGPQGAPDDDGGLPWLEPAPDPDRGSLSFKSLAIIGTIFLLVFIALMAVFYNRIAGSGADGSGLSGGSPTLIAAPAGPFKITPEQDSRAELASNDNRNDAGPRFSGGSERPLSGAEQLEQAAKGAGPAAVSLGSQDEPVLGYVRPAKKTPVAPKETPKIETPKVETPAVVRKEAPKVVAAAKKPAPKVTNPAPVQTASAGGYLLQLGAFSTRDSAMNGWRQFSDKYPGSLSGLAPDIQSFKNSSGRDLYRLRASGLSSRARADARCAALKAANQACFVVAPQ